ncbi:MAG: phytanoyl-CoA dioxygenase family protein [Candidatus Latescibacterota bacterium]|nr:phytanoyl-CoA dioxygenase family protein [Candidatus Latescibacterota bacterium]MEC8991672.1 phytanoyl-CoA dioxygenase family protein [Candidatus Latescibacterota bacterium]MEE3042191.1 phytanoyl-CoA dioxygenase family protein [Candidatus Latescibacterota bacterium]
MLDAPPLESSDIADFDTKGYLIVRKALSADVVESLLEAGDRLVASDLRTGRQMAGDGRYDGFRNTIALDPAFADLIDHRTILPAVVQLLGADLQVMTSHLIYKQPDPPELPDSTRLPGWHRDYAIAMRTMGHRAIPRLLVKCAYYLTDLTQLQQGATMVLPGSHLLEGQPPVADGSVDPDGALEPSLQPGDCLIFENRTFHAGALNRGPHARKAIMVGYGHRWVMPMDYRSQSPEFVAGLSALRCFLVGEAYEEVEEFLPSGGRNPLQEWCEQHDVPASRLPPVQGVGQRSTGVDR